MIFILLISAVTISSCKDKLPYATITLNQNEITLNHTNNTSVIIATVKLADSSSPKQPAIYECDNIKNTPILYLQDFQQKNNNELVIMLDDDQEIPEACSYTIFATYDNSSNKPRIPIKINIEKYIPDYPNAQISVSKDTINLNQTDYNDSITSTVSLNPLPTQETPIVTYDYSEVDNLPVYFNIDQNILNITLEKNVEIAEDTTFSIYATYPHSKNKPQVQVTINVEKYTAPVPTPEEWDDAWIPKADLKISGTTLTGIKKVTKSTLHVPREVTNIANKAFANNALKDVTTVDFPDDSKCVTIGESAFYDCSTIKVINFPKTLANIGTSSLYFCKALEKIDFSSCTALTNIPGSMAQGCDGLTTVRLPPQCVSIGEKAFQDALILTGDLIIPKYVKSIGSEAFLNAGSNPTSARTSINLIFEEGSNLSSAAYASFSSMSCVGTIDFPSSLKTYGNNFFAFNHADVIKINSRSGNLFGMNCFDGVHAKELYLNVDAYFPYPSSFLSWSHILLKDDGKIYVPNSLIDQFKSGWSDFSQKFYPI